MSTPINPYIAGNPVTGSEMFFGREDVFAFIRQALIGQHRDNIIVLYGQRRTGKTSMLYQLPARLGSQYLCVLIDLQAFHLEGIDGFLWEIANRIQRVLPQDHQIELPPLERQVFMTDARTFFQYTFLDQIWSIIGKRHLLLMLDEAIRLEEQVKARKMEPEVFEYMSHLMQHYEQLNFLFSLGSGLEEMEKEYALLFRTALYKKISFLDRASARALMTDPIKGYYDMDPTAQERIFQVTSGHPYCTQLLCHSLFTRWQSQPVECLAVQDVEQALNESVERGLAIFKHVWDESTSAEKAVMVAIATITGTTSVPVSRDDINQVWKRYQAAIPQGEMTKALKSLIARDVIAGTDTYTFTVDLQRLWIQKYRGLNGVAEEIAEAMHQWTTLSQSGVLQTLPPMRPTGRTLNLRVLLFTILALVILIGGLGFFYVKSNGSSASMNSNSLTPAGIYATATSGDPTINDPLLSIPPDLTQGNSGSIGGCSFDAVARAYTVWTDYAGTVENCLSAPADTFSNFAFQVQMTLIEGDAGGLIFRYNGADEYRFNVGPLNGQEPGNPPYNFIVTVNGDKGQGAACCDVLATGTSQAINQYLYQTNILTVVARGSNIYLYINGKYINHVTDTHISSGQIGLFAYAASQPTKVIYRYLKVWTL